MNCKKKKSSAEEAKSYYWEPLLISLPTPPGNEPKNASSVVHLFYWIGLFSSSVLSTKQTLEITAPRCPEGNSWVVRESLRSSIRRKRRHLSLLSLANCRVGAQTGDFWGISRVDVLSFCIKHCWLSDLMKAEKHYMQQSRTYQKH